MSNEPMELAKNWDPKHAAKVLPGYAQIKYDGVPITFRREGGIVRALTRQNEEAKSVQHIVDFVSAMLTAEGASITAECLVPGLPFKDSSGIVRRQADAGTGRIIGIAFDYNIGAVPKETYYIRREAALKAYQAVNAVWRASGFGNPPLHMAACISVSTVDDVENSWIGLRSKIKSIEGMMIHSLTKPFSPGKRCWGMSRYKPQPTIDLEVLSYEEAISETGEPLGMVGRVNVLLRRQEPGQNDVHESIVGVGPGKLDHAERRFLWDSAMPKMGLPSTKRLVGEMKCIAEIKYMPDPTYDALRQPTIQRLRTDKTEGDILEYA